MRGVFGLVAIPRGRDLRLVLSATLVSVVGDGFVPVALAFAVLDLTHSATELGAVLAIQAAAMLCALLVGGVLADRIGRRVIMIAADLLRLAAQALIGVLLVSGHATIAWIAVAEAVLGLASGFFDPAASGLIPAVAGDQLQQANALRGMAVSAAHIAGPAIAGVLVVAVGPGPALLVDAASFGGSALLLAAVRADPPRDGPRQRMLADMREGFAELRARTWAWANILVFAFANLFVGAIFVLGPVVARQHLGGPGAWAAVLAVQAVGWLVASTLLLHFSPRRPLLVAVLIDVLFEGFEMVLAVPWLPIVLLAAFAAGIGAMVGNTLWETTLQQNVPEHVRSRVAAYDWLGAFALVPVGFAIPGPIAAAIGTRATLLAFGAAGIALLGVLLLVKDIRTMQRLPDGTYLTQTTS
jgi:MFS family permease